MAETKCLNYSCSKANICKRFLLPEGTIIAFEYICKEQNNYYWCKPIETNLEVKEDNNGK